MLPNRNQFEEHTQRRSPVMNLNRQIKRNYPELTEQLTIQLKQQHLADHLCFPWQINCEETPGRVRTKPVGI